MRIKKANHESYKVFINYLVRVLPVFIVPVVVMITIYYTSNNVINQQTYERNLAVLQNSADTLQKTLTNVDNLIAYLNGNTVINNFLTFVNPLKDGSTTVDMLNAQNDLKSLTTANDIIKNIQIYSTQSDILIDSSTNGLYLNRYYEYDYVQGMTFDDWLKNFLKTPHKNKLFTNLSVKSASQTKKCIVYAKSLPISDNVNIKGAVFVYLDEEYILSLFNKIPYQSTGLIYVLDKDNRMILDDNKSGLEKPMADSSRFTKQSGYFTQNIGGKDMFVTYYKTKNNWNYVAALPINQVLQPTEGIRFYTQIVLIFTLLCGGFLVYSSVKKLSKPIANIFAFFAEKNKDLSYNDFEYEISKLVENNEKMQDALNNQIPELKTSIFYNLLIGGYSDSDVIRQNLSKINIDLHAQYYVVLIASVNELNTNNKLEEISAQKIYINGILTQYFENIQGIYNLDFERTVLLLSFDGQKKEDILDKIECISKNVVEHFMTNVMMSVSFAGDITNDILKIPSSFLNAYTAINYKQKKSFTTVQWFIKTVETEKSNFYYPIELESQLITLVNAGNTAKLPELLDKVDRHNSHIITQDFNPVFYNLLLSMNSTLIRIFNESDHPSPKIVKAGAKIATKLNAKEDLPQVYYLLKEALSSIALTNKDVHRKNNTSQQSGILQYIDEHYTDPQLSLTSVADVFSITEVYLSQLFKHISGVNFSKYIENLRLNKAHELIERGFKINEVAQMSGYNSPQVFRRAYKRKYGITPTGAASQESPAEE